MSIRRTRLIPGRSSTGYNGDDRVAGRTMKRMIVVFSAAGLLIPLMLIVGLRVELYINPDRIPRSLLLGRYLWPSSFWLLATNLPGDKSGSGDIAIWVSSILANIVLYALIGVLFGSLRNLMLRNA